jgi:hypothetical protein
MIAAPHWRVHATNPFARVARPYGRVDHPTKAFNTEERDVGTLRGEGAIGACPTPFALLGDALYQYDQELHLASSTAGPA